MDFASIQQLTLQVKSPLARGHGGGGACFWSVCDQDQIWEGGWRYPQSFNCVCISPRQWKRKKPSSIWSSSINNRPLDVSGRGLSKTRTFAFSNLSEAVSGVRTQFMPHHWTVSERDTSESTPFLFDQLATI